MHTHAKYIIMTLRSCVGTRFLSFAVLEASLGDNGDIGEFMLTTYTMSVNCRLDPSVTSDNLKKPSTRGVISWTGNAFLVINSLISSLNLGV